RYVRGFGENGGVRFDLLVRIHLREEGPEHRALACAQFRCWRSWFETPLCRSLLRRGRGFGSPAVFSGGVVSGAFGFEEDRDHFEVPGFAGISSHHREYAIFQRDGRERLTVTTHSYFLFWQRTSRWSTLRQ